MSANTGHHLERCCMCELPAVIFGMLVSLDITLTTVMWWRSWCRVTSIRSSCLHSPWALTTSKSFSTRSSEVRYTHTKSFISEFYFESFTRRVQTHTFSTLSLSSPNLMGTELHSHSHTPLYFMFLSIIFTPEKVRRKRWTTHSVRIWMGETRNSRLFDILFTVGQLTCFIWFIRNKINWIL